MSRMLLTSMAILVALVSSSACATAPPIPTPTPMPRTKADPTATAPVQISPSEPKAAVATPQAVLDKVKFVNSNITGVYGALWTTKEGGLFEKYGLDVEMVTASGSTTGIAAILSGETPLIGVSGSSVVNAVLGGADAVIVASIVDAMPYQVVTTKDVRSVADLRGSKIGINRFGGTADFAARYWLKSQGMDPTKDVAIMQVGGQSERFAALKNGAVQATLVDPPYNIAAEKQGFKVLVDLQELDIPYASTTVVSTRAFVNSKTDIVRRFLKAYVEGIAVYKRNAELGTATLKKYLKLDDSQLLEETRKYWASRTPKSPFVRPEGVRLILEEASAENPKAMDLQPERIADMRLVKELEASGFVDGVQK